MRPVIRQTAIGVVEQALKVEQRSDVRIILAIVVLIFGASRLPELGKGIGSGIKNFKASMKDGADSAEDHKS